MSAKLTSLEDLFFEELRDIYHAELQLVKALPTVARKVSSEKIRRTVEEHLEETRIHVDRLEVTFEKLGQPAKGRKCEVMAALLAEGDRMLAASGEASVRDAGIICCLQKIEHYEIAAYGCVRAFSNLLGREDIAGLLDQTLEEEKHADNTLTGIAEEDINAVATATAGA